MGVRKVLAAAVGIALVLGGGYDGRPSRAVATVHTTLPNGDGDRLLKVGRRPVTVHIPASYQAGSPAPLVILLHGRGASGAIHESYFKLKPESERRGFIYAMPDGTPDKHQARFWDATDACCAPAGTHVNDSKYLTEVIAAIKRVYTIAASRVYLVGLSNGAFMSYRMACDHAELIAGIAALDGAMWQDPGRCRPSTGVAILNIHSRDDQTIRYDGGLRLGREYPSALATVTDWIRFNHCAPTPAPTIPDQDYIDPAGEPETTIVRYTVGCTAPVESWSIRQGGHVPPLRPAFITAMLDFLFSQQKP